MDEWGNQNPGEPIEFKGSFNQPKGSYNQPKQTTPESEGYAVFLSNIPEGARVSNLLGVLKKHLGPFKTCNLIKLNYGTCKIAFESEENRDKVLNEPFEVFGNSITTSDRPINRPLGFQRYSLYIAGLQQSSVKQVLGSIKAVIGEFAVTNTVIVENGCSMVTFKDPKKGQELLAKGLSVSAMPVFLSTEPFRGQRMGMKRGFGQLGDQSSSHFLGDQPSSHFIKRQRREGGYSGYQETQPNPFSSHPAQLSQEDIEDIQLENKRLKLRVQYLEQQVTMYEEVLVKRRKQPSY